MNNGNAFITHAALALNAEELKICHAMGLSIEDFARAKQAPDTITGPAFQGTQTQDNDANGQALNAEERKVCHAMGLSIEEFAKTKTQD